MHILKLVVAAVAIAVVAGSAKSQQANRTTLGTLECRVAGGVGLLLGSSREALCTFTHEDDSTEEYTGRLGKLGIDIGASGDSYLGWIVFTPLGNEYGSFALQGRYVGISVAGSLGIGLGINALVGGSNKKIGLQPFSVEGKSGLNFAAGLTSLRLDPLE